MSNVFYGLKFDCLPVLLRKPSYVNKVRKTIKVFTPNVSDDDMSRLMKDIRNSYLKYRISPAEYFLFDFEHKSDKDRKEYIGDKVIYMTMAKVEGRKLHDEQLEDKYNFYQIAKEYFKRDAIRVSTLGDATAFDAFCDKSPDIIVKPNSSACGSGISVAHVKDKVDIKRTFEKMMKDGGEWIVEELIRQSDEMSSWNESSVNTIRISSFLKDGKISILCPFLRTGRKGSVVDNGGQGGIYASVDEKNGIILTDGKDELCHVYKEHPDSHLGYKGWQVPDWQELVALTEKVHQLFPQHRYVGWDFAHTSNGWVLIEGNWGEFICQQSSMGRGYKKEFLRLLQV